MSNKYKFRDLPGEHKSELAQVFSKLAQVFRMRAGTRETCA